MRERQHPTVNDRLGPWILDSVRNLTRRTGCSCSGIVEGREGRGTSKGSTTEGNAGKARTGRWQTHERRKRGMEIYLDPEPCDTQFVLGEGLDQTEEETRLARSFAPKGLESDRGEKPSSNKRSFIRNQEEQARRCQPPLTSRAWKLTCTRSRKLGEGTVRQETGRGGLRKEGVRSRDTTTPCIIKR